jgi:hemerythrin-like domain-containing protein
MKITEALIAEHGVFHGLFDQIERSVPRLKTLAEIKTVAALLDSTMAPHSQIEDELFVEPLAHCLEQLGQNKNFHDEHEEIEAALRTVRTSRDVRTARKLLLQIVADCRKHFDKEERIVFPMAEQVLNAKTLEELGAKWMRRRQSVSW